MKRQEEDALLTLQVNLERWFKKHRIKIYATIGVVIAYFAIFAIWNMVENSRINAANVALNTLILDPNNAKAREDLQAKSPDLYDLFLLKEALANSDTETLKQLSNKPSIVGKIATYQLASISGNFETYSQSQDAMLKDFAALQEGYLLIKEGKDPSVAFGKIAIGSELKPVADTLEHYKVK